MEGEAPPEEEQKRGLDLDDVAEESKERPVTEEASFVTPFKILPVYLNS